MTAWKTKIRRDELLHYYRLNFGDHCRTELSASRPQGVRENSQRVVLGALAGVMLATDHRAVTRPALPNQKGALGSR